MAPTRRGRMARFGFKNAMILAVALVALAFLFTPLETETKDEEDPDCVEADLRAAVDQCAYVRKFCEEESQIPYMRMHYCYFPKNFRWLSLTVMARLSFLFARVSFLCLDISFEYSRDFAFHKYLVILGILYFYLLGQTADRFFIPTLERMSTGLRLSPGVAGVTLLALGNAAPDLFSTFQAIQEGYYAQAFGQTIGAGMFVTHVVVGVVALIAPASTNRRPFLRNIGFLTIGICTLFIVTSDHYIHYYEAIILLAYYVLFVIMVFIGRMIYQRNKQTKQKKMLAQERDRLLSMGLNLPITHPIFNLDMDIFEDPEVDTVLLPFVKQVVEAVEKNDFDKLEDLKQGESDEDRERKQRILTKVLHQLDITYMSKIGFWREGLSGHHFKPHGHVEGSTYDESLLETNKSEMIGVLDPSVERNDIEKSDEEEAPPTDFFPWLLWFIDWNELSLFQKVISIILSPIMVVQYLSIHWAEEGKYWRVLYVIHPPAMGFMFLFFQSWLGSEVYYRKTLYLGLVLYYVLGVAVILSLVVFFTTKNHEPPIYDPLFLATGFVMSCVWINAFAGELVQLLNVMGDIFAIPKAILGLTVLAWGNSVGDLVANSLMAKKGFSETALAASFTAPFVHLLVALGSGFLYKTLKHGTIHLDVLKPENPDLNNTIFLSFMAVLFGLFITMLWVPIAGFKFTRPHAIVLIVIYVAFMIVGALDVKEIIFPNVRLWLW